ncbi:SDR family oxidoreductase [Bradyrhizobium ottawaense]|uniref:SDR family NAD(P)-dependent oxidoreductase n=1 Tax=Bradyrhizobium ottawaense TaxID=931866 RepID=UPI00313CD0E7
MAKDSLCAIVTGSASGLGAATAEILARSGARLVINYSSSQKEAEATADVCRKAGSPEVGSSIAYAASKGALNTMTLSLSRALAPLIRVNTVCPGYIDTPWFTKGRGEAGAKQVRDSVVAKVPLRVASTAEDIAQLVCFLAMPASSNMTGEVVRMDAGMHLIT